MTEPHWKGRGIAAAAVARKSAEAAPKPPRDYLGPAIASLGASLGAPLKDADPNLRTSLGAPLKNSDPNLLAAIIVAQALDRFGERLIEVAAIANYKRAP